MLKIYYQSSRSPLPLATVIKFSARGRFLKRISNIFNSNLMNFDSILGYNAE